MTLLPIGDVVYAPGKIPLRSTLDGVRIGSGARLLLEAGLGRAFFINTGKCRMDRQ